MFTKGSRYRNLPQSSSLTARGERLQGIDLRIIAGRPGTFLHTVQDSDRLDLLAYKYYGDATKWWQICDANGIAFPIELVDTSPLTQQEIRLAHSGSESRYQSLLKTLGGFGTVDIETHDFVQAVVVMNYNGTAATRQQILGAIKNQGFNFIRAFQWSAGAGAAEAFTFDDHSVKTAWRALIEGLSDLTGVIEVQSVLSEATLNLVFNRAMFNDQTLVGLISAKGFTADPPPTEFSRTGMTIVVPPNQIA